MKDNLGGPGARPEKGDGDMIWEWLIPVLPKMKGGA
jgi:hypothetical protein